MREEGPSSIQCSLGFYYYQIDSGAVPKKWCKAKTQSERKTKELRLFLWSV